MLRKLVAITLFVSFIAMATSGMLMFVIEKPSFTIQMHPVHKLFGLLLVLAVIGHLCFNMRMLLQHLRARGTQALGAVLVVGLVLLYAAAMNNKVDPALARQMDDAAAKAEAH